MADQNLNQEEIETDGQFDEAKEYFWTKGKFSYGGRNKTYGLINAVFNIENNQLLKLDLVITDEGLDIGLEDDLSQFATIISDLKVGYRSRKRKRDLIEKIENSKREDLLIAMTEDDTEGVNEVFKEEIEEIIQESIKLEVKIEPLTISQLEETYPELFTEEVEEDSTSEDESEENTSGLEMSDTKLELKCSPIVSAVQGKRVTNIQVGEKLVVEVIDDRNIGQDIAELLQQQEGKVVGAVEGVMHNQELDRYQVMLKFKGNIYGKLVVGREVKLKTLSNNKNKVDQSQPESDISFDLDQEILLLFGVLGIIILVLIGAFILI
ncbi:hypothetical protein JCM16358_18730 [Halanaerocella petrolearia]